ncbi:MafB19-like deaminase [Halopenitus malekzadehii]|uniref:MafB19-like deaminase n=1 Tax=Halopenitus malekzadehii TaxID=1267564 RepID=A0A1H6HXU1_9EURY|nr:nucleoside deaminase [Halopenitus malekzadehii]SEH39915.1 MafB19-like deaminase [Halopenitus malekzadehii]
MTDAPKLDTVDHETHLRRAIELARVAADRGDEPFGSVLVRDDRIVAEASNRVHTADDVRRHPELDLAARAVRDATPAERARTVMYTSTEPCPMCSGGIRSAGLGRVVYAVGSDEIAEFQGEPMPPVRSRDVLAGVTEVVGPVSNAAGRTVHTEYGWDGRRDD